MDITSSNSENLFSQFKQKQAKSIKHIEYLKMQEIQDNSRAVPNHQQSATLHRDTFELELSMAGDRLDIQLQDLSEQIKYRGTYSETQIEDINRLVDIKDILYCCIRCSKSQCSYILGDIILDEDGRNCLKVGPRGSLTFYKSAVTKFRFLKSQQSIIQINLVLKQIESILKPSQKRSLETNREGSRGWEELSNNQFQCLVQRLDNLEKICKQIQKFQIEDNSRSLASRSLERVIKQRPENNPERMQFGFSPGWSRQLLQKNSGLFIITNKFEYLGDKSFQYAKYMLYVCNQEQKEFKFEVKILKTLHCNIMIGVLDYEKEKNSRSCSKPTSNAIYYYGKDGIIFPAKKKQGKGFVENDLVCVTVSRIKREISWSVNNKEEAKMQSELLQFDRRILAPYIEFFDKGDKVEFLGETANTMLIDD